MSHEPKWTPIFRAGKKTTSAMALVALASLAPLKINHSNDGMQTIENNLQNTVLHSYKGHNLRGFWLSAGTCEIFMCHIDIGLRIFDLL